MKQELRMQLLLLVAFNGWRQVLEELAHVENVDLVTIEREIEQIRSGSAQRKTSKKKARRRKSGYELVRDAALSEAVHSTVERLVLAYERKEFLPDLWQVRQFLGAHGIETTKTRSRGDALPKVVRVLAALTCDELGQLAAQSQDGRNELSIITDHILGPAQGGEQPAASRRSDVKRDIGAVTAEPPAHPRP